MRDGKKKGPTQLELPFNRAAPSAQRSEPPSEPRRSAVLPSDPPKRPGLVVLQGGGQRVHEPLESRDAVVRVLVEAGADLLLRRITSERADEIQKKVDSVLRLFDDVDVSPHLMPVLKRKLDDLEALMRETRAQRARRHGG